MANKIQKVVNDSKYPEITEEIIEMLFDLELHRDDVFSSIQTDYGTPTSDLNEMIDDVLIVGGFL